MDNPHQRLFDNAAKGLIAQGQPAINHNSKLCAYRTATGLKCAIGHSISDDQYYPDMEEQPLYTILPKIGFPNDETLAFALELQKAHDHTASDHFDPTDWLQAWRVAMIKLASRYNLDPKEVMS